ncbi:uncharacterized protein DFL_001273 [Arthrobotrys flagrans]|uniref:Bacteriophage T5 Orf172 DNA-binding domain-containing protein n=1 Tax=Arthrobotrys flagrans TaxID=97331 RepID=A0A437AGV1_ARTFL|nr:hypothetical protein DFL_001273 [Arthrobotrys flagrans]
MPYIASTPEALEARLGRTDSLDPATTCRGISISSGKPCRRNITAKAPSGKKSTASSSNGGQPNPAEAFFCWQHKDQAADTVVLHRTDSQKKRRMQGRTSFDSLVEVILGPEAANSQVGPGQTQLLIRRETRLNADEVMVVSKNTVAKKDSKIVKTAKKPGESQNAIWDALHNQQNGAAQGSDQAPYGSDANGQAQYPHMNGQYQDPQANGQYQQQQQYQHPGTHGISQVQQHYPPHRPSAPAMGRIDETPGDTYPPNNEFKPPPPRPNSYRPKRSSLLAQLFCCLSVEDNNDTPPPRPHVQAQHQQAPPQMQSVRPTHQPPPPINTTPYQGNYQAVPPQQVQQAPSRPSSHHPPHLKFDAPIRLEYPPNIHVHNGWDKTPYPPNMDDDELPSSSADEDSDGDDAESIALPDEAVSSLSPTLPLHLSAKTRTKITTEMRKPISQKDMPGYIYIFWLKDDTSAPLPVPASAPPTVSSFNIPPLPSNNGYLKPRKNSYIKDPGSAALFRVVEDPYDDDDDDESGAISPTSNRRSRGASISAAPSSPGGSKPGEKRVLLKIGRAQNVQRRLHQWSQQCGYNLQLLRYYPYVSLQDVPSAASLKSGSPSPAHTPGTPGLSVRTPLSGKPSSPPANLGAKKVPFSHRVERLIHLELRDGYYNEPHVCETCQTVHKEWFAVPGTRDGIKRVDEVIKRWCKWAESLEGAVNNREQGGVSDGLGHRRGDSGVAAVGSQNSKLKEERTVTGGVRGVERMQWAEGYESHEGQGADDADEQAKRQTRVDRMGTFGFL